MADSLDLVNRDPNNINDHLQCKFEDVLAEPDGTHSIDCVWKLSYTCFTLWKSLCYRLSTLCCGICIAAELGCQFAQVSFVHVWVLTPCLRALHVECNSLKKMWSQCVGCCLEPCCLNCSLVFSAFKKGT